MAVTLIGEIINSCDATTGFNVGNISGDDDFIEGSGAIGLKCSGALCAMYTTTLGAGAPYDYSSGGAEDGYHIIMWFNTKTSRQTTGGLRITVGDGTNRASWYVTPLGFYEGGFVTAVVNTARDFDVIDAGTWTTTGNPAQLTAVSEVGGTFNMLATIMGSFNNIQLDQMTTGLGLRIDAGTGGAPNTFETVRSADEDTNFWGFWASAAGAFLGKGKLYIGPSTGTAASVFTDSDFVVAFAEERVATGFYEIDTRGSNTDVTWTRGLIFAANPAQARWGINIQSDTKTFTATNCNFIGSDTITLNSSSTITGGSITDGTLLDQNGATLDGISVIDANTADGVAYIDSDNPGNISDCSFTFSDGHAIEILKDARKKAMSAAIADDGGSLTDETTASNNTTTNDMTLLPATPAVNDAYYFGRTASFDELELNISTAGSGTWTITWEYWNGTAWGALSGVTDGTTGFTVSGTNAVTYTVPSDWATTTVNSQGPFYYIRARVSAYTSVTTAPQGEQSWVYQESATYTFDGNAFTGYGAGGTNDAAIYNNSGGEIVLNIQNASVPTIRNGTGASTSADVTVTVKVTTRDADTLALVSGVRVLLEADTGGNLPYQDSVTITRSGSTASVSHTAHGLANGDKVKIKGANEDEYNGVRTISNVTTNAYDYTVTGTPATPATGTITATSVILDGETTSGVLQDTGFKFTSTQPVTGKTRKGTATTYYKTATITGSIISTGFDTTVVMVKDE